MGHLKIDIQFEKKIKILIVMESTKIALFFLNISPIFYYVMGRYNKDNECSCQIVKVGKK